METTNSATFAFKGVQFTYNPATTSFSCDAKPLLYVMSNYFPNVCSEATKLDTKLESILAELKTMPENERTLLDSEWKHAKEAPQTETNVTEEEEKVSQNGETEMKADSKKSGMISRLSKGIKKIIAKITPKKLHKRFHLTDDSF